MHLFGIDWVGLNVENVRKLLVSLLFIAALLAFGVALRGAVGLVLRRTDHATTQTRFWTRQGISLLTALVLVFGLLSIWFNEPTRLATAFGLMSAGLAFALQQVITSVAGYFVILRGSNFTVGDRISMGGVRGDVMRLGFIQTTIMEMGQPANVQPAAPGVWVRSRQFTGRIVTVANSKIFSEPVFNYTRDFPFIWEEMMVPIHHRANHAQAEALLLAAARGHSIDPHAMLGAAKADLQERFGIAPLDLEPRVFLRITHDWLELNVRFVVATHGTRAVKDAITRDVLRDFAAAGIAIAPARHEIAGMPPLEIARRAPAGESDAAG